MMAGYVVTWDGDPSSVFTGLYIRTMRRRMLGELRDVRVVMPGRDGAWLFNERRGVRLITAECTLVEGPDTRHDEIVAVADWLDRQGERELIISDQPDRFWLASLAADPDPEEWRSLGKFTLEWAAQPYAFAVATSSQAVTATGAASGIDADSFTIPDDVQAYPEVEIRPLNGTLTAFNLTILGTSLTWEGLITSGNRETISSISYTVVSGASVDTDLVGIYNVANLDMAYVDGEFPLLQPGLNSWSFNWDGTATNIAITIRWRRRYR